MTLRDEIAALAGGKDADITAVYLDTVLAIVDRHEATFDRHTTAVADFLREMYATMIDPIEDGPENVREMCDALLTAAREQRQKFAEARFSRPVPLTIDELLHGIDKPSEERPARETVWLVERLWNNDLYYFSARKAFGINGVTLNDRNYSKDANDAIRFSREEDAMVALNYLCGNEGRVAGHCWIDWL